LACVDTETESVQTNSAEDDGWDGEVKPEFRLVLDLLVMRCYLVNTIVATSKPGDKRIKSQSTEGGSENDSNDWTSGNVSELSRGEIVRWDTVDLRSEE
jgi:hypothetical protein